MTVPYRTWTNFRRGILTAKNFLTYPRDWASDWTEYHDPNPSPFLGAENPYGHGPGEENTHWQGVFRPYANLGFESLESMDEIVDVTFGVRLHRCYFNDDCDVDEFDMIQGFTDNDNPWHHQRVSGKYYDGESQWDSWPPQIPGYNNPLVALPAYWEPKFYDCAMHSWTVGWGGYAAGVWANRFMDDFFRGGAYFKAANPSPAFPASTKEYKIALSPQYMNVRYFNPIVNQCLVGDDLVERYWVPINTAIKFTLIGMGFNNDDDELDNNPLGVSGGDTRPGGWGDLVDVIEFWRQQDKLMAFWRDDFGGGAIDSDWTIKNTDADRTIAQAAGVLTISVADGVDGRWYWTADTAPKIYRSLSDTGATPPFEVVAKVNAFVLNDDHACGLWIGYHDAVHLHPLGHDACQFGPDRADAGPGAGLKARRVEGTDSSTRPGVAPEWLKIKVDEDEEVSFWYSNDGSDWTQLLTLVGADWIPYVMAAGWYASDMQIGLYAGALDVVSVGVIEAPFEYFEINWGGSPYAVLREDAGDFTVDDNLTITIPSNKFPMLEEGTYILRIIKEGMDFSPRDASVDVWGWAGDWRCTAGGLIFDGERIVIDAKVGPPSREPRERGGSIILVEAEKLLKSTLAVSKEWWSEDDVRAPDKFYEGILMETSSFRRCLDDKIGMFKIADMTLRLSNHKKKFSELLALYDFKDQLVKLYHSFIDEPEYRKTHIVTMVVEDYNIEGTNFEMILKDVSQKYFGINVPRTVCEKGSEEEGKFPNLHEDYIGWAMPEVLGLASLTEGELKGAVQAVYVDTTTYKYLAAAGGLSSITEVYADNVFVASSLYELIWDDGRTFIVFNGDQGDARITFNCTGYSRDGWNSENGYIQNPAWILKYFLSALMEVPEKLLDPRSESYTALANVYIAMGEEESGKLILQNQRGAAEVLRELCFSFGAKCWVTKDGSFAVGRKSLGLVSSDILIFEQNDILSSVKRKMGLRDFITRFSGEFNYFPYHGIYDGVATQIREDIEERIGVPKEDKPVKPIRRTRE